MVAVAKKKKKKKADQTAAGATAPASMGSDDGLLRVSNPIMEGGGTVQVEASGFEGSNDDTFENELGEDQGEIAVAQSPRRKNYTGRSGKQLWQILRAEATTITTMTAMWGASHSLETHHTHLSRPDEMSTDYITGEQLGSYFKSGRHFQCQLHSF